MQSFWISFCELYFLLCSLTSEPFAIATELPVNHTLSFVENLKKLQISTRPSKLDVHNKNYLYLLIKSVEKSHTVKRLLVYTVYALQS
jgi:hypothetical protein